MITTIDPLALSHAKRQRPTMNQRALAELLARYSSGAKSGCEIVANAMRRSLDQRRIYQPLDHEGHDGQDGYVARAIRELQAHLALREIKLARWEDACRDECLTRIRRQGNRRPHEVRGSAASNACFGE